MEQISVFDIFKIGVGPSSSHTMGPWVAALSFLKVVGSRKINQINIQLYGSLAKTGKGHGTDVAVMLGLMGYDPKTIKTKKINHYIAEVNESNQLCINDSYNVPFTPAVNIEFMSSSTNIISKFKLIIVEDIHILFFCELELLQAFVRLCSGGAYLIVRKTLSSIDFKFEFLIVGEIIVEDENYHRMLVDVENLWCSRDKLSYL